MNKAPGAVCMPLLPRMVSLTPEALRSAWQTLWPEQPGLSVVDFKEDAFTCEFDGARGGGLVIPAAVPNDEVSGPALTSWLWPNAAADLYNYGAHAVVFGAADKGPLAAMEVMTRLAAAVMQATGALGVYMGGAGSVVRADVFIAMATQQPLPVALWVDLRCIRAEDVRSGLFTVGLRQFGLMEIEIPDSSRSCGDLRTWTMSLASYLIESRPEIGHGETVGLSADERVRVEHAPSVLDREGPVYRLSGV